MINWCVSFDVREKKWREDCSFENGSLECVCFFSFYVVFETEGKSDHVTFYSSYNPNNESYILAPPCDLLRMIKWHLGSEGCKAESAVVNEPRHPSQLLPRLCSLARNKSHSRRYA